MTLKAVQPESFFAPNGILSSEGCNRVLAYVNTLERLKPLAPERAIVALLLLLNAPSTLPFCSEYHEFVITAISQLLPCVRGQNLRGRSLDQF